MSQDDSGVQKPIYYVSRVLSGAQRTVPPYQEACICIDTCGKEALPLFSSICCIGDHQPTTQTCSF